MMMMKLPILPCAEKLELVLSTAPKTWDNTDTDSKRLIPHHLMWRGWLVSCLVSLWWRLFTRAVTKTVCTTDKSISRWQLRQYKYKVALIVRMTIDNIPWRLVLDSKAEVKHSVKSYSQNLSFLCIIGKVISYDGQCNTNEISKSCALMWNGLKVNFPKKCSLSQLIHWLLLPLISRQEA